MKKTADQLFMQMRKEKGLVVHRLDLLTEEVMDEYAKQQAIEFAEWIDRNRWRGIHSPVYKDSMWCDESDYEWMGEAERLITTTELYSKFLEEQK